MLHNKLTTEVKNISTQSRRTRSRFLDFNAKSKPDFRENGSLTSRNKYENARQSHLKKIMLAIWHYGILWYSKLARGG
jgi:hypothetical protein